MMPDKHLNDSRKNDLVFDKKKKDKNRIQKNAPSFNVDKKSFQLFNGVELIEIPGIRYSTVLQIMSEVGESIVKFTSAKAFSSWLRLAPNKKITGGKVIGNSIRHSANVRSVLGF